MTESVTDDECGESKRWVYNWLHEASTCVSTECSMDNPVDKVRIDSYMLEVTLYFAQSLLLALCL